MQIHVFHFQRMLDGYEFPVYTTESCPRDETEWNKRSDTINCTEDNGYLCLPNENITGLLEFCYKYPFILIQEGKCTVTIILNKNKWSKHCPSSFTQDHKYDILTKNNSLSKQIQMF